MANIFEENIFISIILTFIGCWKFLNYVWYYILDISFCSLKYIFNFVSDDLFKLINHNTNFNLT